MPPHAGRARAQPKGDKVEAVPCSSKSPKQQWTSTDLFGTTTHVLKNKASGKCLQARVATRSSRFGIRRGRGNSGARRARLGPAPQASQARRVRQVNNGCWNVWRSCNREHRTLKMGDCGTESYHKSGFPPFPPHAASSLPALCRVRPHPHARTSAVG